MAKYGLIGDKLTHSQSKNLHALIGNYEYDLIEVPDKSGLKAVLDNTEYDGFNITSPYKEAIMEHLDKVTDRAKAVNAVNVVKRMPDGKLYGYNTDVGGFGVMVGARVTDRKCMILGTGGAARAAAIALDKLGAKEIVFVSRNPEEAIKKFGKKYPIITYDKMENYYDIQVLVNATPIGMIPHSDQTPMALALHSPRIFQNLELAVDLIYNPYRTKFLQDARRITGCKTMSGLEMLLYQAIEARNIWADERSESLSRAFTEGSIKRKILENQLNIVAVGMPGSGKTTIFRRYAYELGFKFIDIDAETEKLMGDTIENVLGEGGKGEAYFREMESKAIKEASMGTGAVIATGGGSILNPINRDLLRSNGVVIYMKRPLNSLSMNGRPISQKYGVKELFNCRDKIYQRMADMTIKNTKTFGAKKAKTGEGDSYYYELKKFVYGIKKKIERYMDEIASNKWT